MKQNKKIVFKIKKNFTPVFVLKRLSPFILGFTFLLSFAGCNKSNNDYLESDINNFLSKEANKKQWEIEMEKVETLSKVDNSISHYSGVYKYFYFGFLNFYNFAFDDYLWNHYQYGSLKESTDHGQSLLSSKILKTTPKAYYVLTYTESNIDDGIISPELVLVNREINLYKIISLKNNFPDMEKTLEFIHDQIIASSDGDFIDNIKKITKNMVCNNPNTNYSKDWYLCDPLTGYENKLELKINEYFGFIDSISNDFVYSSDIKKIDGWIDVNFFFLNIGDSSDKMNITLKSTWRFYFHKNDHPTYNILRVQVFENPK